MIFGLYGMFLLPVLLLFASLCGETEQSGGTVLPNSLPEEDHVVLYTSAPFLTTKESRTSAQTDQQLLTSAVLTTPGAPVSPSPKTMAPAFNNREERLNQTTVSTVALTSLKPTLSSPPTSPPPKNSSTPAVQDNNPTTTATSSPSTSFHSTQKGPQCNCSAEGILNCDPSTCRRECVTGYLGPQCDECEDGYFTNGTSGCQQCGCDTFGAVGSSCDSSGVCTCKTGVFGDKCDDCRQGFFHFSSNGCQPCQCNNHTSNCDTQSGLCLNCQGNTIGRSCEQCKYNFYREPGSSPTQACLPCPCSSVTSTGSCTLDSTGQPVCDQCKTEYQGNNCEQCRDGFYNADSICVLCNCSGNAEPKSGPRICHPDTGYCLNCSYNTVGAHCERCAQGFKGDALYRNCTRIVLTTPPPTTPTFTMTLSPNGTEQLPTLSTALISSLTSTVVNSTSATTANVSWAQFNVIVLAVIIVVLVALMGVAGGVYTYREYQNRKLNAPFWTIELKEDNISFSSYHDSIPNADVSGLLEDEMSEVVSNGQLTLSGTGNLYKA